MSTSLLGIGVAVPETVLERDQVVAGARRIFAGGTADIDRLLPIYANAGVDKRHSCVPLDWYFRPCSWSERNTLFLDNALDLMEQAASRAIEEAGLTVEAIDVIIAVSSTGIATPSLDARLMERMAFRRDVARLPIFGLGCAGGVLGLARAAALAAGQPRARILLVVVELCGLTFRSNDQSNANVVATALFGDGAAAVVLGPAAGRPRITGWGEHTWPQSLDVMGWRVEDDGFGVLFAQSIPLLVRERFRPALDAFLAGQGLDARAIDHYVCHPGGAKVLAALEQALGLAPGRLAEERAILREFGNMSAATVLFILHRRLQGGISGRSLMTALGPGFTAGFLLLEAP